jgi:hypothetical protein
MRPTEVEEQTIKPQPHGQPAQMVVVPTQFGLRWLQRGWQLFRASPFMWMTMLFAYWVMMGVIGIVPFAGSIAAVVLIPVFSVSFMHMCRALDARRALELGHLFAGFRANLPALLLLGGVYLAATTASLALTQFADGGHLMRWMMFGTPIPEAAFRNGSMSGAALLGMVLYLPILAAFWFAPVLAAWNGMSATKALFYSFFAMLANWRAFLLYGMAILGVGTLIPGMTIAFLGALLHGSPTAQTVVPTLIVMFLIALVPTLFASFYASYRDVFPPTPQQPPPLPVREQDGGDQEEGSQKNGD